VTIQIQRVLNAGAQVMILGTSSTNAVPVNNWAALGSPIPIIGGIGLSSPLQIRGAEDAGKKVSAIVAYFTGDDPLPRQKEMVAEFQKTEGKVAQYQNGSGWDGVMMLARVLESGADTREKVRDALETMFTKWEGVAGIYTFSKTSHQGYDPDGLIFVQYLGDGHYKRWSK
jgi:ABC-type branched-subunit amino acid transport system substrate-binding protein